MLIIAQQTFKLNLEDVKINKIYPIDADNFLVLSQAAKKNKFHSLRYIKSTGQLTWAISQHPQSQIRLKIIKNDEILVFYEKQRLFKIINLNDRAKVKFLKIRWYKEKQMEVKNIFTFSQSNMIALHIEDKFCTTVMFYSYSSFKQRTKPLKTWIYYESIYLNKVNNFGALGWEQTESACTDYLKFHIIKFDKDECSVKKEIITTINRLEECFCIESRIGQKQLFQISENRYLVHTEPFFKEIIQVAFNQNQSFYANNFLIDASKGPQQAIIEKTKYSQSIKQFQGQIMTSIVSGPWLIYTFSDKPSANIQVIKYTVLLINFQSGQFIKQKHSRAAHETMSFYTNDWAPSIIATALTSKQTNNQSIKIRRYISLKQHYLGFLLHLNQDLDDDLLQETIQLLVSDI